MRSEYIKALTLKRGRLTYSPNVWRLLRAFVAKGRLSTWRLFLEILGELEPITAPSQAGTSYKRLCLEPVGQ
jgi:hypothetical protein